MPLTLPENIHDSPDWFPARIDFFQRTAQLCRMSPQHYRDSVFLDPARISSEGVQQVDLAWLEQQGDRAPRQSAGVIFHTAFCGSTLMSQALETRFQCLSLREPEALGNVMVYLHSATDSPDVKAAWLQRVMNLLARRYESGQGVVIKANDYANGLMLDLVNGDYDVPILFMYTPLTEFLAGCLKADNRRQWIQNRYEAARVVAQQLFELSEPLAIAGDAWGEMAAVYWCYNVALYLQAHAADSHQVRSLDFNDLLADPLRRIDAGGRFFGLTSYYDQDSGQAVDSLFGVYSKNSAFRYNATQRSKDIEKVLSAYAQHGEAAETLARQLLAASYPDNGLPGRLDGTL